MSLALPNSIYMNMDFQASAYEMWKYLEALHRTEELHHFRMKQILESCLRMNPLKTILPAPPSPAVDHGLLIYTPNGLFFNPPNAPEPFFIPQYHPATLHNNVQSLLQNLVKISQVSSKKGNGDITSTSECLNTMEDTNDEEDLIEPSMAFLAYTENIADEEAQDYDSTPVFDDNVEYNATLCQMEVEGGNLNTVLQSVMGDIPSDDEYADLESNTADLEIDTADVMLMANMQEVKQRENESQMHELSHSRIISDFIQVTSQALSNSRNSQNRAVKQSERVVIQGSITQRLVGNGENTANVVNVGNEVKILEDNSGVMDDTEPVYDTNASDDSKDPFERKMTEAEKRAINSTENCLAHFESVKTQCKILSDAWFPTGVPLMHSSELE
jgi:hypothetical protein